MLNATDIGQGAQTGIAQIVADEMDADWSKVCVEMAPVDVADGEQARAFHCSRCSWHDRHVAIAGRSVPSPCATDAGALTRTCVPGARSVSHGVMQGTPSSVTLSGVETGE